jgi:hypothetical protein
MSALPSKAEIGGVTDSVPHAASTTPMLKLAKASITGATKYRENGMVTNEVLWGQNPGPRLPARRACGSPASRYFGFAAQGAPAGSFVLLTVVRRDSLLSFFNRPGMAS